ncbi:MULTISPECIES: DNA adenine methylase [unclassified Modestobacter]|uniref:DNA adenine methylase n=1 Tax=unclassified Modestobacter TaxID=2643866 RepID=UPI0022AA3CB9|nr:MULTISPECIES: DNA adenine methylase [unclassified Modestobacter]MCZ2826043.1 DNA adenine methylase [Modestobacter sp. VKM Ac-2981]MCZ2852892.1 DNA adenine methylase [Modestobacter sp. VKM Ac-2982]
MPEATITPAKLSKLADAPYAFPYQGSKRALAHAIVPLIPTGTPRLIEPFAGSAAVAIGALHSGAVQAAHIRDLNAPLMALWDAVLATPAQLADEYEHLWKLGHDDAAGTFRLARDRFNISHRPADLLYLLNRIVKAAIRYNAKGEFNQGADNRRLGAKPKVTRDRIMRTAKCLGDRTTTSTGDYAELLHMAGPGDVVYMDPPYQGTSGSRDSRYVSGLPREAFARELARAVDTGVSFLISYDGTTGGRSYGANLPDELGLLHLHLRAGTSSQSTLQGGSEETIESLYVSPALVARLGGIDGALNRLRPTLGELQLPA